MSKRVGINIAIFIFTIAIIFLSYSAVSDFFLKQRGVKTEGIVIYLSTTRRANGYFLNYSNPVVRYVDSNGKDYTILDCESCHKIGEKVPVIYDPQNPEKAIINTISSDFSLVYYLVGFIGLLIFFIILRNKSGSQ